MAAAAASSSLQPEYDLLADKIMDDLNTNIEHLKRTLKEQEHAKQQLEGRGFNNADDILIYLYAYHRLNPAIYTSKIKSEYLYARNLKKELKENNFAKYDALIKMIDTKILGKSATSTGPAAGAESMGGRRRMHRKRSHTRRHKKARKHTRRQRQRQRA